LETSQEKLLQILLVGQPELDEKLDSIELRQLKQRIAARSHLQPLDLEETTGYIRRRLQLSGVRPDLAMLFPADTIAEVYRRSRGIPRLINTVCENALISAYARQLQNVPPEIIEEVATDFRLDVLPTRRAEPAMNNDISDVFQAVKTLLQVRDQCKARVRERTTYR
jgi:general secretion pathway protein A